MDEKIIIEKIKDDLLPITWEGWDGFDVLCLQLYNVTFTEDFGVFTKDEFFKSIFVSYQNGTIECYKENDKNPAKKQKFKLTPILD